MRQLQKLHDTCLVEPARYDARRGRYVTLADVRITNAMRKVEDVCILISAILCMLTLGAALGVFVFCCIFQTIG